MARALVGRIGVALLLLLIFASYSILLVFLICFSSFLFLASVLHETFTIMTYISPGQTDRQVDASGRKLNLRRDLRWVAKRTGKFPHKYRRVAKKAISRQTYLVIHWLIIG